MHPSPAEYWASSTSSKKKEGEVLFMTGRPAPEDLETVGLPASAARRGHQKHIPMFEHGWSFPLLAREDLSVCANHTGVVWCECTDVHDPVVL